MGRSKPTAVAFMWNLEGKFRKNPSVKADYVKAVQEYIERRHAVPAKGSESESLRSDGSYDCYYLPHLAVIKESSKTTKTRIVFHASAPTSNKLSLNDCLLIGPTIQPDLVEKLIDFRVHPFVFVCDVEKMYRKINMAEKHWNYQLFCPVDLNCVSGRLTALMSWQIYQTAILPHPKLLDLWIALERRRRCFTFSSHLSFHSRLQKDSLAVNCYQRKRSCLIHWVGCSHSLSLQK